MVHSSADQNRKYEAVAQAIDYIRCNARRQPSLAEIAASVNLSEYHLQRIFSEWAGISPKRFLQYLTKEHARQALRRSMDVLSATLESGLSSPGRLHDLMISCEAMTPGEIRMHGRGVEVGYGQAPTPFGTALIAWTPRGICHMAFCDNDGDEQAQVLFSEWAEARIVRDNEEAARLSQRIFPSEPHVGKLQTLVHFFCAT